MYCLYRRWLVLLDTAAFVPHHTLNLTAVQADFAVVSFYKIFGCALFHLSANLYTVPFVSPPYWCTVHSAVAPDIHLHTTTTAREHACGMYTLKCLRSPLC